MGLDDSGERTRFPCLATARYIVAAVVTVLAIVVIVMVVVVGLRRPADNINLIINSGAAAPGLWELETTYFARGVTYSYVAARYVSFRLSLSARNPSGRADVYCDRISGVVGDMPNGPDNFTGMVEIKNFDEEKPFTLRRQTTHTLLTSWFNVEDKSVLQYIAAAYGGRSSFTAMVQVDVAVSSDNKAAAAPAPKTKKQDDSQKVVRYYCWPVTVATLGAIRGSSDAVTCKLSELMDVPVYFNVLPALAPAPAPT